MLLRLKKSYHLGPHDERGSPLLIVELIVMQGCAKGVPKLVGQKVAALRPIARVLTICNPRSPRSVLTNLESSYFARRILRKSCSNVQMINRLNIFIFRRVSFRFPICISRYWRISGGCKKSFLGRSGGVFGGCVGLFGGLSWGLPMGLSGSCVDGVWRGIWGVFGGCLGASWGCWGMSGGVVLRVS